MSFHVDFIAGSPADAQKIVAEERQLPESVRTFVTLALTGLPDGMPVAVKAIGHLFSGSDYSTSTAQLQVNSLAMRVPKDPPAAAPA
jgi:hypothetical protein